MNAAFGTYSGLEKQQNVIFIIVLTLRAALRNFSSRIIFVHISILNRTDTSFCCRDHYYI